MRACKNFGPSGESLNPDFGAILAFLGHRKGVFFAQLTLGPFFFKPLLSCGGPPCGIYTLDKIIRQEAAAAALFALATGCAAARARTPCCRRTPLALAALPPACSQIPLPPHSLHLVGRRPCGQGSYRAAAL